MSQSNFQEISQPSSVDAIAIFLNNYLILEGITVVKTKLKDNCLQIFVAANSIPPQEKCVECIRNNLLIIDNSLKKVTVYGMQMGEDFPEWHQEFELTEQLSIVQKTDSVAIAPSLWNSVTKKATGFGKSLSSTMSQTGKSIIEKTSWLSETITPAAVNNSVTKITDKVDSLIEEVSNNPHLQNLTETFQNWLIENINKVDIVRAETYVKQLQQKYPHETTSQIAHRLIIEKATYAGGAELANSILPDIAATMFAVNLAATTLLQVEMVYQIACVYGMDLKESARKEEILTIFGLSLGGSQFLQASVGCLKNVPIAGAVIGASSNALAVYALGYAACRFYETKNNPLAIEASLEEIQAAIAHPTNTIPTP